MTTSTVNRLREILNEAPKKLLSLSEEAAAKRPAPGKWSKKEIIGHLIDSAANNHQRFVRLQIENSLDLLQYRQNEWVNVQHYQDRNWIDLVKFWMIYNMHILHLLNTMDQGKLGHTGTFPDHGTQTLQFIVDDYVDHLVHHLKQVMA
jgi:hypothetical protein